MYFRPRIVTRSTTSAAPCYGRRDGLGARPRVVVRRNGCGDLVVGWRGCRGRGAQSGRDPRALRRSRSRDRVARSPAGHGAGGARGALACRKEPPRYGCGRGDQSARTHRCASRWCSAREGTRLGREQADCWRGSSRRAPARPFRSSRRRRSASAFSVRRVARLRRSHGHLPGRRAARGSSPGARRDARRRGRRGVRQGREAPRPRLPGRSGDRPPREERRPLARSPGQADGAQEGLRVQLLGPQDAGSRDRRACTPGDRAGDR